MQDANLFMKHPPDNEQRFGLYGQVGQGLDQLLDAGLEFRRPYHPDPKLRKVPRGSLSIAIAFDCSSLRWVSSIRSF
jgi:hypothetical protein